MSREERKAGARSEGRKNRMSKSVDTENRMSESGAIAEGNGLPKAGARAVGNGIPEAGGTAEENGIPEAGATAVGNGIPETGGTAEENGIPEAGVMAEENGMPKAGATAVGNGIPEAGGTAEENGMPEAGMTAEGNILQEMGPEFENMENTDGLLENVREAAMKSMPHILSAILDVGELMLIAGAEVNRVENTIRLMGKAYGFIRVDVFTITSSIVVTVRGQEEIITQTRRILGYETDMWKIERCNELSRLVCSAPLPLEQLEEKIGEIRQGKRYSDILLFFLYGGISGAFSIYFGGSAGDGLAAVFCGLLLWTELRIGKRLKVQNIVLTLVCSALIALGAVFFKEIGLAESVDKVIIGNIMPLIPGLALTVSLRDMISGDMISGLLGLCEAILRAVAIAVGVALVLWKFGW